MENYINVYKDVLTNKYAQFDGRTERVEFWSFILVNLLASLALSIIGSILHTSLLENLYSLALLIPSLAIGSRRLHDLNKSGWWQLLGLIPIIGWIILIVWAATKGDVGPNTFGVEPKTPEMPKLATHAETTPPTPPTTPVQ